MRTAALAPVLALTLSLITMAGCTGAVSGVGTRPAGPSGAGDQPVAEQTTATTPAVSTGSSTGTPGSSGAPSASQLAAMRTQLDAMQKEIDALPLPGDNDFSDAEGAVY